MVKTSPTCSKMMSDLHFLTWYHMVINCSRVCADVAVIHFVLCMFTDGPFFPGYMFLRPKRVFLWLLSYILFKKHLPIYLIFSFQVVLGVSKAITIHLSPSLMKKFEVCPLLKYHSCPPMASLHAAPMIFFPLSRGSKWQLYLSQLSLRREESGELWGLISSLVLIA